MAAALAGFVVMAGATLACGSDEEGHASWGYTGDTGPEHWAGLNADYAACGEGIAQSPVDIPAGAVRTTGEMAFLYEPIETTVVNNGHTVEVRFPEGSNNFLTVDDEVIKERRYKLIQVHFHTASEHTLAGEHAPVELHLVHRDTEDDSKLAVVGVLIQSGDENSALAPLLENLPPHDERIEGVEFDASVLLPADQSSHYRYPGSLTTPGCAEVVRWMVMAEPLQISAQQIAAFEASYKDNNRPVQPINNRSFGSFD